MRRPRVVLLPLLALMLLLAAPSRSTTQVSNQLAACAECAYSTEEDFITQGPLPPDGNPLISDGDLLSCQGAVCMRNADLLHVYDESQDLGLDAADVLDVERELVAFSTELNSTHGTFTHGDLLTTWGAIIPNQALLRLFQISADRGLDAVHFVGKIEAILAFHELAADTPREAWLTDPDLLVQELKAREIDIWFSIEGTELWASTVPILDGDLLSAATGQIVARNSTLLHASVPACIPQRGVDFGLDAVTAPRGGPWQGVRFSTEILYRGETAFDDGDVLWVADGVVKSSHDLYAPFEPEADFLGTDALYMHLTEGHEFGFLSLILKFFKGLRLSR